MLTAGIGLPGKTGERGLSGALWGSLADDRSRHNMNAGRLIVEDFDVFSTPATNEHVGRLPYNSYTDTGATIAQLATDHNGAVALTNDTTDNDEIWLQAGDTTSVHARISDASGQRDSVLFECRWKVSSIADANSGVFIGLGEEGLAAADTITDADALASKDLIGFFRAAGDGDQLDIVHRKAGSALVEVDTDILSTANNSPITALTADTYVKTGFRYHWDHPKGPRIEYFVNGYLLATAFELTSGDPYTFPATFPDGEELAALFGIKNGGAAASVLTLDWWAFYQGELSPVPGSFVDSSAHQPLAGAGN